MKRLARLTTAAVILLGGCAAANAEIMACNNFRAPIRLALAYDSDGGATSAGWWRIEPNSCRDIDFAFKGASLYYTADSEPYKDGSKTYRDHWGNKKEFFVSSKDFKTNEANRKWRGAKPMMFSQTELSPQQQAKPVVITYHFTHGRTTTEIKFK